MGTSFNGEETLRSYSQFTCSLVTSALQYSFGEVQVKHESTIYKKFPEQKSEESWGKGKKVEMHYSWTPQ